MKNMIGQSLGRYHILEQLGEGGMAVVYKAFDTRLKAEVAVKVIRTERLIPELAKKTLKCFEREAKAGKAFGGRDEMYLWVTGIIYTIISGLVIIKLLNQNVDSETG